MNTKIKFSWYMGYMEINAEDIIENVLMTKYREWAKLFARYGKTEQHTAFLQLVNTYIEDQKAKCAELENDLIEQQMKADRKIPTQMSQSYLQKQVRLCKSHLNGAKSKLKRYQTIYKVLEGLLS